jgi:DNA helicase-2/ATP-dependent DNA helicase PcrA
MAVFYRTNAQSRPFEEQLLRAGIPYQIVGGIRFYQRKEIKDVLAHLHLLVNPRDAVALHRVASCRAAGVGPKTVEAVLSQAAANGLAAMDLLAAPDFRGRYRGRCSAKLEAFAGWCRALRAIPHSPVGECVQAVLEHSGLLELYGASDSRDPQGADRVENLHSLVSRAFEYDRDHPEAAVEALLEEVALVSDVDFHDPESDSLVLMTLHSSKGLEFPHVFIAGVEEGYLPHLNTRDDPAAVEEERRLLYVGITRAQQAVNLTHVMSRFLWDGPQPRLPSRFLKELPNARVERLNLARDPWRWKRW